MGEHKGLQRIDILTLNLLRTTPRCMRTRTAQPDDIGTQTIHPSGKAALGNRLKTLIIQRDAI